MKTLRCSRCMASPVCPYALFGAKCIYSTPGPERTVEARRAIRRAHLINMVGCGLSIAGLLAAVGLKVA